MKHLIKMLDFLNIKLNQAHQNDRYSKYQQNHGIDWLLIKVKIQLYLNIHPDGLYM